MPKYQTLDDMSDEDYAAVEAPIRNFKSGNKTRDQQHDLYERMTRAGLSPEYADEFINMLVEN